MTPLKEAASYSNYTPMTKSNKDGHKEDTPGMTSGKKNYSVIKDDEISAITVDKSNIEADYSEDFDD
jgi:hypothetical protein